MMRECEVVTANCMSAPDSGESCLTTCFACGMPACHDCTTIVTRWYRWRRKRVCLDCLEDHGRGDEAETVLLGA